MEEIPKIMKENSLSVFFFLSLVRKIISFWLLAPRASGAAAAKAKGIFIASTILWHFAARHH